MDSIGPLRSFAIHSTSKDIKVFVVKSQYQQHQSWDSLSYLPRPSRMEKKNYLLYSRCCGIWQASWPIALRNFQDTILVLKVHLQPHQMPKVLNCSEVAFEPLWDHKSLAMHQMEWLTTLSSSFLRLDVKRFLGFSSPILSKGDIFGKDWKSQKVPMSYTASRQCLLVSPL